MKGKTLFKDKYGNEIILNKKFIGVRNAQGKFINPHATKKFLKEQGFKTITKDKKLYTILK